MPPKKRALEEIDANVQAPAAKSVKTSMKKSKNNDGEPKNAKASSDNASAKPNSGGNPDDASTASAPDKEKQVSMDKKDPYEYITMPRPFYDFKAEEEARGDDDLDEDELFDKYEEAHQDAKCDQPAADAPDHTWIIMRGSWISFVDGMREATYRSPDNFGMYIYNDWEGYGMHEMVQNYLVAYQQAFAEKKQNLKDMWVAMAGFAHWLKSPNLDPYCHIDDGEQFFETNKIIKLAMLSMLNALDRAGELKQDSEFKDIGLVIGIFATAMEGLKSIADEDEKLALTSYIIKYAKDKDIDMSVVFAMKSAASEWELNEDDAWPKPAVDRWQFGKEFAKFKRKHTRGGKLGGQQFDITKMSKRERVSHAFDGKDPLAHIPAKALKEGLLTFE